VNIVLALYGLTVILIILHLFTRNAILEKASSLSLILSATSHLAYTILLGIRIGEIPISNIPQAVNMMILLASFIFIAAVLLKNAISLGVFFAPFAIFTLSLVSGSLGLDNVLVHKSEFWFFLHTSCVITGDALFMVSGIASVVYIIHERLIKKGTIHSAASNLPPLVLLDKIIASTLSAGFIAMTAGMIIGGFWASNAGLKLSLITPKIVSGAVMWIIFAFSLHQRFAIGWRGRRTAVITLAGFLVMAMLTILIEILYPGAHGLRILP
jgi:ABC-type transport system involved in cytochrome c biogenesis permease subunit